MSRPSVMAVGLALCSAAGALGCAATKRAYTADELRAEVLRRAPGVPAGELFVPHEITPEQAELARTIVGEARSDVEQVRLLAAALFDPRHFGLRYSFGATTTAKQTLAAREGNCLGLAAAFVGLARAVGLKAYYMDATTRVHDTRRIDEMTVTAGHVTALVKAGDASIGLDFGELGPIVWYRILDDIEALAHFYNNRGFEHIEDAAGADWVAAERDFRLAVSVMPGFAPAWNNLGIAAAHQGRVDEAIADYRTAIAHDSTLAAPLNNLGSLELDRGHGAAALHAFEAAARLEPDGPHIQYNLAQARLKIGDKPGAVSALRRAIDLRAEFPRARALLAQLEAAPD